MDGLNCALIAEDFAQRWRTKTHFAVLASDFKQGEMFLCTCLKWLQDPERCQRLHYFAFVSADYSSPKLTEASTSNELDPLIAEVQKKWPHAVRGFHRIYLQQNSIVLTLIFGDFCVQINEVLGPIDAFILNDACPVLEATVLKQIWRLCRADSTIVSTAIDVQSQENLKTTGFSSTINNKHPYPLLSAHCLRAPKSSNLAHCNKEAIIIGAGLAGCSAAASLVERGWQISIFDSQSSIASQASGNHVGLCHPTFSLDDNFQARLSRAGFFVAQQKLNGLLDAKQTVHFAADGHFQIAKDAASAQLMQQIISEQQFPNSLVCWLSAEQAQLQHAIHCDFGGWWFPQGMWINPASTCHGYLNLDKRKINLELNTHINTIKYANSKWQLYNDKGCLVAQTATLILANAHDAARLLPDAELALSSSLRSVTRLPTQHINATTIGLSGTTYLTAEFAGWRCAGASPVDATLSDLAVEASNLNDLKSLIGSAALLDSTGAVTRQCTRPNSADRLPLVGQVPDTSSITHSVHQLFHIPRVDGLYAVLGFGSRGLTWHALAAEVLACQLNQEPQGIERSLIDAIDPARFALRRLRKLTSSQQTKRKTNADGE